jgi:outer membrane protein assembly factor BamA
LSKLKGVELRLKGALPYSKATACALAAALLLFIGFFPAVSRVDTSIIPLPVYDTSRNGGDEYGVMPVFLLKEKSEYIYGIIAPSVIYNANTGVNITFRYLGYPTTDENYRIFINRSTKVDQEYTGEYWNYKILDDKFKIYARMTFFRDSTYRFFGLTQGSPEKDETNYSNEELTPEFVLGYYLPHNFLISYGERLRWVTILKGTAKSLPYIKDEFPSLQGINGGAVIERQATLSYDTRDETLFPTKGWYSNLYGMLGQSFTHDRVFSRIGIDGRTFISTDGKGFVTVLRAAFQMTGGHDIPFFELSTIGGENTLRGFGDFRFRDKGYILFNVEERIRLFKLRLFDVWSEWEMAPFVDMGRVYSSLRKEPLEDYQINPGVGFRAIVQPNVVGRVDLGYGKEGINAFVGLDFPF